MKALLGLLIVILAGYLALQFIPPYFSYYQFKDDVATEAKFAGPENRNDDQVRAALMKKVKEYGIPVIPEQIKINREDRTVTVGVDYTVVVDLIGDKHVPLNFHVASN